MILVATSAFGAVSDVTITDVTTRAFSVVWASNEAVTGATVRVFTDANGTNEITPSLNLTLVSSNFPPALAKGIVKVTVSGLTPDTSFFVKTETTTAGGTLPFPTMPPFIEARTEVATTKANASNQLIVNDLISHDLFAPDGATPATGALLMVAAPGLGSTPLTAFVGEGFPAPKAVVDLNNLFESASGSSAEVGPLQRLEVTEFRGLTCPGLANHKLLRFRRAAAHEESPRITELETPEECFFVDTVCDDTVNILDVQRVLNIFNRTMGECAFNPDLDVIGDNVINILDVQSVLNRFGQSAPFPQ